MSIRLVLFVLFLGTKDLEEIERRFEGLAIVTRKAAVQFLDRLACLAMFSTLTQSLYFAFVQFGKWM